MSHKLNLTMKFINERKKIQKQYKTNITSRERGTRGRALSFVSVRFGDDLKGVQAGMCVVD